MKLKQQVLKAFLGCILRLVESLQSFKGACPERPIFNQKVTEVTPLNIPFTLVLISSTDIVEENTTVDIVSDSYQYQNSYLKRYLKYHYYVARIKNRERSFAFGSIDLTNMATLFDGIIYESGKLHFVEGIQVWKNLTSDLLGKSALSDKWGMRKWVKEKKYMYYTEDDIEPWYRINDTLGVPSVRDKSGLSRVWRRQLDVKAEAINNQGNSREWYSNNKKVCGVNVLLDSYLMEKVYHYDIREAIHETIILYGALDFLYRIVDFAGIKQPNHFGFQIAKITVVIKKNDPVTQQNVYPLANKYMALISSMGLGDNRCLGISFTFQNFRGIQGQAWIGADETGIFMDKSSKRPANENQNVAYVNFFLYKKGGVRTRGSILSILAHEVGHTFGAEHEEDTACISSTILLMNSRSRESNRFDNFKFSKCNVRLIKRIIRKRMGKFIKCPHELRVYDDFFYPRYGRIC
ncbi:unnamed protein product [Gordionus sp. m RMFG-2023]|uniref:disintegrin and metalloproteinase domain-containing protein 10-like n=1 Tax=Gordionus sp. m RMFG-2023 TaxID=3053472 RepID=UPI0030DF4FA8